MQRTPEGAARADRASLADTIRYLAISHSHGDHIGNANDYAGSTWIVQKAELDVMFAEKRPRSFDVYKSLDTSKRSGPPGGRLRRIRRRLNGHQVDTGPHAGTPGAVREARPNPGRSSSAATCITSPRRRTLDRVPTFEFNKEQTRASRAAIEAFMTKSRCAVVDSARH